MKDGLKGLLIKERRNSIRAGTKGPHPTKGQDTKQPHIAASEKSKTLDSLSGIVHSNNDTRILNDRVDFRLFAAEQHLKRLKELEALHGDIAKDQARLQVEMEIDCFLSQIIGAVDSLLFQINSVLQLGIPHDRVTFQNVQSGLSAKTKNITLLNDLDFARQPHHWYSLLCELRNQSMHRTFLKKIVAIQDLSAKPAQMRFLKVQKEVEGNPFEEVMQEEIIPYLEKSLENVRKIIIGIRKSEPLLENSLQESD